MTWNYWKREAVAEVIIFCLGIDHCCREIDYPIIDKDTLPINLGIELVQIIFASDWKFKFLPQTFTSPIPLLLIAVSWLLSWKLFLDYGLYKKANPMEPNTFPFSEPLSSMKSVWQWQGLLTLPQHYYTKRMQRKLNKGKDTWIETQSKTRCRLLNALSQWSHTGHA